MNTIAPKPMLAYKCTEDEIASLLKFPVYGQPKLDGVRALVHGGVVYGRSGKPIKNKRVQRLYGGAEWLDGWDGELICGSPTAPDACRVTSGVLNSPDDETHVDFHAYDLFPNTPDVLEFPFSERTETLLSIVSATPAIAVETHLLVNAAEVLAFEQEMLALGYEGIILRDPKALYKQGRASKRNSCLWALKRFADHEASIIGFTEEMHNANEAKEDAFGRTERSSHKANKLGKGTLGALVCESERWTDTFEIGTGFTAHDREVMWRERDRLLGRKVKFRYFEHGTKDRPRHPVFISIRIEADMPDAS